MRTDDYGSTVNALDYHFECNHSFNNEETLIINGRA